MQKLYKIKVDISKKYAMPAFEVNTNDLKSIKLSVEVLNGSSPLDLSDKTVRIAIRKPDNNIVFQDCEIKDAAAGQVEVILENQAYVTPGTHTAEIMCYKGSDVVAVTGTFSYKSTKGIMNDEAVESKSEFTAIDRKIEEARKLLEDIGENGVGVDEQARQEIQQVTEQLADTVKEVNGVKPNNGKITLPIPEVDTTNLRTKTEPISLNDMTPETLAAIEGGEGTTFNLLSVPRPKSVTPETTTFIKSSSNNLFNKDDVTLNKTFQSADGAIIDSTSRGITNYYIPVTPGQIYTRTNSSLVVSYYDANKNWIRTSTLSTSALTATVPDNAYFMQFSVSKTSIDTLMVNFGDTLLPYEPYGTAELSQDIKIPSVDALKGDINAVDNRVKKFESRLLPFRSYSYQRGTYENLVSSLNDTGCTIETLGVCSDGTTQVYGLSYGDLANKPVIFTIGNQHGMEWNSAYYPVEFMTRIAKADFYDADLVNKLRNTFAFYHIVSANPWGFINSKYVNANGVNLNRNWDNKWANYASGEGTIQYKGTAPFSEPETRMIRDKINSLKPYMIIDCHASDEKGGIYTGSTEYGTTLKTLYQELFHIFNDSSIPVQEWKVGDAPTATGWAVNQTSKEGTKSIPGLIEQPMDFTGNYGLTTLFAFSVLAYNRYVGA